MEHTMSTHAIERAEVVARVAFEADEERCRSDMPACDVPLTLLYQAALTEAKTQLLAGPVYQGLITRQYKRQERVLELTMHWMQRIVEEEDYQRVQLGVSERTDSGRLVRYGVLLAYYATAGYQGTTIAAETDEREARGVALVEERDAWELVGEREAIERELAAARQTARYGREIAEVAVLADEEGCGRWNVVDSEYDTRIDVERLFLVDWRELFARLVWRLIQCEYDARLRVEAMERRARLSALAPAFEAVSMAWRDALSRQLAPNAVTLVSSSTAVSPGHEVNTDSGAAGTVPDLSSASAATDALPTAHDAASAAHVEPQPSDNMNCDNRVGDVSEPAGFEEVPLWQRSPPSSGCASPTQDPWLDVDKAWSAELTTHL
jgi:hypothetical protein